MDYQAFCEEFTRIFEKNGLGEWCRTEIIENFFVLTQRMVETNAVMNITALTTTDKIIPLHYADCVLAAKYIPENAKVVDIGCGGGFPILPLAIIRPDLTLVGVDSTAKKIRYVQSVADELGLSVTGVAGRAEEYQETCRETFDVAISRAVARLNILDELCMPYVKVGGKFIAMKGAAGEEEKQEALNGIKTLGGSLTAMTEYELYTEQGSEARTLIEIQKAGQTPEKYPRAFGAIKKKPL